MKILIKTMIIVSIIAVLSMFSLYKSGTLNFIRSSFGVIGVLVLNDDVEQIANTPDIFILSPDLDVEEFLDSQGYKELKEIRAGAIRHYLKDKRVYIVLARMNSYYTKLTIEEKDDQ